MPRNIKDITLWTGDKNYNGIPLVRVNFEFPCTWTVFHIDDLKQIIRLWIRGEELRYPREEGYAGRMLLFEEIQKVFKEA